MTEDIRSQLTAAAERGANAIRHLIPRCECGSASEFEKDLPDSAQGNPREKRRCINPRCRIPFAVQYRGLLTIHNA